MCVSSESHIGDAKAFLTECSADVPCSDPGQTCVCFCTIPCTNDDVCRDELRDLGLDDSHIVCRPPSCGDAPVDGDSGAVCDVSCLEDADCAPLSAEHRCAGGFCRRPAPTSETGAGGNASMCPDGSALVGAPSGDVCMQTTEVTVEDFKACVAASGCTAPTVGNYFVTGRDTHPIQQVTLAQAEEYCAYVGEGVRLPTREEWTFAARGGDADTDYPWGATVPDATDAPARVCALISMEQTCPVATYPSGDSPLGLSDLSGNVAELVKDGTDVCVAGGSYLDTDAALLGADSCLPYTDAADSIGFRCVTPM